MKTGKHSRFRNGVEVMSDRQLEGKLMFSSTDFRLNIQGNFGFVLMCYIFSFNMIIIPYLYIENLLVLLNKIYYIIN